MNATRLGVSLTVTDLTRAHRATDRPALDGLNVSVSAGECVALLGPSGSGKSTALRCIAGVDVPTRGSVVIDGVDMTAVPPERRRVGFLTQRPLLFPHLSVLDNVAFADRANGASRRAARATARHHLDLVSAGELADRGSSELSGGQAQRVALARTLAARPGILLLDEPFSALDTALRTQMYDLLRRIRAELAPTIVVVTHDQSEAATVAERIGLLDDGVMVHLSSVTDAFRRPQSIAAHRIMGGLNSIAGEVRDHRHHSRLGVVELPDDHPRIVGRGHLVIRQERVRITTAGPTTRDGTVTDIEPIGINRRVVVDVNGEPVTADVTDDSPLHVGDVVGVHLPPDHCWVIP
ncbi:ABC transporter ATP-binding protein [Williamsia sp. CHRR-6]|uniref:ABC transporter ATP-binding protein n=1 Tax=Williamsia sp. CHRR-6 TaxID=2835871 RepID=UPI001BD99FAE|nr:ABC transporter ATP-binding protein [Williamsia sp. CHRR-6]MBT0566618.1 ABC transporter ATP-binding protein [Williamsia sp. CHRR-6]